MKIIILILLVSSVYNLNFVFNVDKPVKKSKNEVPHYQQQRNIFQWVLSLFIICYESIVPVV